MSERRRLSVPIRVRLVRADGAPPWRDLAPRLGALLQRHPWLGARIRRGRPLEPPTARP